MSNPKVIDVNRKDFNIVYKFFFSMEDMSEQDCSEHVFFSFKNSHNKIRVTLFNSGKMVIQGKAESEDFIQEIIKEMPICVALDRHTSAKGLGNESVEKKNQHYIIGADESGKGDTFGPICFAAVYIDNFSIDKVRHFARDSKEICNKKISEYAEDIRESCLYAECAVSPSEYNVKQRDIGLQHMMISCHTKNINEVYRKISERNHGVTAILDKIMLSKPDQACLVSNVECPIQLIEKAENKYAAVACASILSRDLFIKEMNEISRIWEMYLPKGSSHVDHVVKQFVAVYGIDNLKMVAKYHFLNVQKLLNRMLKKGK